jgi:hypothetical protein
MNGFEVGKFVVISVNADAEEQAGVSPVDNFVVSKLVSRLSSISKHSRGGIPRQNSIDTSGLVGQLSDVLPHVVGPAVKG